MSRKRSSATSVLAVAATIWVAAGAVAGVVESLLVALRHGYYFNTVGSLLSFLFLPAVTYAAAGIVIGAALVVAFVPFAGRGAPRVGQNASHAGRGVPGGSARSRAGAALRLVTALCVPFFIFLFWGSALQGRFFGTVGNAVGHIAMVVLSVLAFIGVRRLVRGSRSHGMVLLVSVTVLLLLIAPITALVVLPHGSPSSDGDKQAGVRRKSTSTGVSRPNILLVTIDTLRADRTGYSGYRSRSLPGGDGLGTTPRLDALAEQGTVFVNVIVPEVVTDPSHASLLTAVPPWVHGVTRNAMPLGTDVPVLAESLSAAGYQAVAIVSVEHLDGHISHMSRGFELFIDRGWEDRYRHHVGGRVLERHARTLFARERRATQTAAAAARWLASRTPASERDGPFFMWLHLFDPHMPYVNHETGRVFSMGERDAYAAYAGRVAGGESGATGEEETVFDGHATGVERTTIGTASAAYDSEIRFADTALGTVLDALGEAGVLDETVVVVTADHGEHMNEERIAPENWYAHVDVYDEVCRVPLVMAGPGITGGGRIDRQLSSMDVAPTILELAGVPGGLGGRAGFAGEIDGGYLSGLAAGEFRREGETAAHVEALITMANPHRGLSDRGVRNGRWKLIERSGLPTELYDLEADEAETMNLIHLMPPVVGELAAILLETPGPVCGLVGAEASGELDPALREMLEALGYVR